MPEPKAPTCDGTRILFKTNIRNVELGQAPVPQLLPTLGLCHLVGTVVLTREIRSCRQLLLTIMIRARKVGNFSCRNITQEEIYKL